MAAVTARHVAPFRAHGGRRYREVRPLRRTDRAGRGLGSWARRPVPGAAFVAGAPSVQSCGAASAAYLARLVKGPAPHEGPATSGPPCGSFRNGSPQWPARYLCSTVRHVKRGAARSQRSTVFVADPAHGPGLEPAPNRRALPECARGEWSFKANGVLRCGVSPSVTRMSLEKQDAAMGDAHTFRVMRPRGPVEFTRSVLEPLCQPLEDGVVSVARRVWPSSQRSSGFSFLTTGVRGW
jgi:hypothetical protein